MLLQNQLLALGYLQTCQGEADNNAVDGVLGPRTDNAIRLFQATNQLAMDGVVGPLTWGALFSIDAQPAPEGQGRATLQPPPPAPPARRRGLIAFSSSRKTNGESTEIYVITEDGRELLRLTDAPGNDSSPTWSPDGSRIAFVSERTGFMEVWVMWADGSHQTQVTCSFGRNWPSWSPDGSRLIMVNPGSLYQVSLNDLTEIEMPPVKAHDLHPEAPDWHPTGESIVLGGMALNGLSLEVLLFNLADRSVKQLTHGGFYEPVWSPDGQRLAAHNGTDIFVMNAHGENVTRLTRNEAVSGHPTWSPDGGRLAFWSQRNGASELWVMNTDGTDLRRLTGAREGGDYDPDWQP